MKLAQSHDGCAPYYPCEPIYSVFTLSVALGVPEKALRRVAASASDSYRLAWEERKSDGSVRQTYDACPALKSIQRRIQGHILGRVLFPDYLNGSLKGRSTRKNAQPHVGAKIVISEDIANFFPTISPSLVKAMWRGVFGFSDEVSALLSALTTKGDGVPQGAITSPYIANLVFWAFEPALCRKFKAQGWVYTRYVDDITVSSQRQLSNSEKSEIISGICGMLRACGVKPKRKKHDVSTAKKRITTTKLVHNTRVSLTKEARQDIRSTVFRLEQRVAFDERDAKLHKELASASSRVGRLNSFHPTEGAALKARLKRLRSVIEAERQVSQIGNSDGRLEDASFSAEPPPWEF